MSDAKGHAIASLADIYAEALTIETEAVDRYGQLADQMETHNNREIAAIFRKMEAIEAKHRDEIARRAEHADLAGVAVKFRWTGPDGPEMIDFADVHYLMTPRQALRLARHNEERAAAYFSDVAARAADLEIKAFAAGLADEEREHVAWIDQWIAKCDEDHPDWDEDPDPAVLTE